MHSRLPALDPRRPVLTTACALLAWLLGLLPGVLLAQQPAYTISGVVLDAETEQPLPGATVAVLDTDLGTATDLNGRYRFAAPLEPGAYRLRFSFVGYAGTERVVDLAEDPQVVLDPVRLETDIIGAEEVVVTGTAGPTERRQLGNTIASVDARQLDLAGTVSIDQALAGKIAGATVQQNSGDPAGGLSIRLRGPSTVLGSADPLYIIDGVIVDNESPVLLDLGGNAQNRLVDLNPEDIARIEVVKGAAAAALYGSRANNGVVQIFTKRGQTGAPRVTFSTTVKTEAVRETLPVNEFPFDAPEGDPDRAPVERFDAQEDIFRRAYGTEQYLSVSGGTAGTRYFVSGAYTGTQGIIDENAFRRVNGRARLDQSLANWASLSAGAAYSYSESDDVPNGGLTSNYGALTGFIFGPNTFDPRPDATGAFPSAGVLANPLEVIDVYEFGQETGRFIGDLQLNLVPIEGLGIDYVLGLDTYDQTATAFIPPGTSAPGLGRGFARRAERSSLQLNNDLTVRYRTALAPTLASTTVLGGSLQYEEENTFAAQSEVTRLEVVQAGALPETPGDVRNTRTLYGFFAQQTFGLAGRLFVTVAGRVDASSSFGADERWQFYPKVSASYLLSEENLWQRSALIDYVNTLRLRASYGESGGLTSLDFFGRFTNYEPVPYDGEPGFRQPTRLGNEGIQPERQREFEAGLDLAFFDNRLGIDFTYYFQRVDDLLLTRSLAPSTGFLDRPENVGELTNEGVEVFVRALPVNRPGFRWGTSLAFSTNANEVSGVENDLLLLPESFNLSAAANGEPLGVFYGAAFARNEAGQVVDADGNPLERDDDGFFDGIPARADAPQLIGDPNPDWTASFINEFDVGQNWSARIQLDAVYGQDVFNFTRRLAALPAFGTLEDSERELRGDLPAGYNAAVFNTFENWIEDGSYLKLREVSVSYRFTPRALGLTNTEVTVFGRNLFSIDDYSGYDPETSVGGQRTGVRGFDFVQVPIPRTFGLSVTATL